MQLHQLPDGVFVAEQVCFPSRNKAVWFCHEVDPPPPRSVEQEPDEHTTRHNGLSFVVQVAEQPHEGRPVALRVFQGGGHRVDAGRMLLLQHLMSRFSDPRGGNVARPFGFGRRGRNGANTRQIEGNSNTFVLQEASRLPPDNKLCAVCQMDFVDGDVLRALPCLHLFHSECVDQWLATNRNCPTCRVCLVQQTSTCPPPPPRLEGRTGRYYGHGRSRGRSPSGAGIGHAATPTPSQPLRCFIGSRVAPVCCLGVGGEHLPMLSSFVTT